MTDNIMYVLEVSYAPKENQLTLDGLCKRTDNENRIYFIRKRTNIPWIPTLYIACLEENIVRIKELINAHLSFESLKEINRIIPQCSIRRLCRPKERIFWTYQKNNFLYTIEFPDVRSRNSALRFLQWNTDSTNLYGLPILQDSIPIDILIRSRLHQFGRLDCRDINDEETDFSMCTWCSYDKINGNFLIKLTLEELQRNNIQDDVMRYIPIISYDIETIARYDSILPRGTEYDQAISSIALTIHNGLWEPEIRTSLILLYTPMETTESNQRYKDEISDFYAAKNIKVLFFQSEIILLCFFLELMEKNTLVSEFLRVQDARAAAIITGYNVYDYDYAVICSRLFYFGLYELAMKVSSLRNKFSKRHISFDVYKHIRQRHIVEGGLSLDNVSKFFGAEAKLSLTNEQRTMKMKFNAVAIRHAYKFDDSEKKIFFQPTHLSRDEEINLYDIIDYNIQDCICVFYLMKNINFITNIVLYARHFYVEIEQASYIGNSVLLPKSLFVQTIKQVGILLESNNNSTSQWYCSLRSSDESTSGNEDFQLSDLLTLEKAANGECEGSGVYDECDILRIGEKKYLGGLNNATPGHYVNAIHLDFKSFYPSIACEYGLSFETVKLMQKWLLRQIVPNDFCTNEMFRVFDYEPPNSLLVKEYRNWYEGKEIRKVAEIFDDKHRVLTVRQRPLENPIISHLWKYYLSERERYKRNLTSAKSEYEKKMFTSMEKMFKTLGNSLYGYLNYKYSMCYAPTVAAAITLLARKTFHETTTFLREKMKMRIIYEDTDGMIVTSEKCVNMNEQELNGFGKHLANEATKHLNMPNIILEYEHSSRKTVVMGKKKYWYFDGKKIISKGFEKHTSIVIKNIFKLLQENIPFGTFNFCMIKNLQNFYFNLFAFMTTCVENETFSVKDFTFNMILTPRTTKGAESDFIDKTLRENNYDVGDRVKCIFRLDDRDPEKSDFCIFENFDAKKDKLNYYKFLRRYIMYIVQVVEGCKRLEIDHHHYNIPLHYKRTAVEFNREFLEAYRIWCREHRSDTVYADLFYKSNTCINYKQMFELI